MRKYRDRLDIVFEILTIAKAGARKAAIMYQANLSFTLIQKYLHMLQATRLLTNANEQRCYYTTKKGKAFLVDYSKVKDLSAQLGQEMAKLRTMKGRVLQEYRLEKKAEK